MWIKCSDKLPPIDQRVLTSDYEGYIATAELWGDYSWYGGDLMIPIDDIKYWMLLPELPKD